MSSAISPIMRSFDSAIAGPSPSFWFGNQAPSPADGEWKEARLGSLYVHRNGALSATLYQKVADNGDSDDWAVFMYGSDGEASVITATDAANSLNGHLASVAAVGATSVTTVLWPAVIAGQGWIVIDPFTAECEVRAVTTVAGQTVSFAAALQYEHAAGDLVLYHTHGELNALWFGAGTAKSAAVNGAAFAAMVAQAKKSGNPKLMYIPGANAAYQFDTTIVLQTTGSVYGLSLRGDKPIPRRGEIYTHGTILHYTPGDATNAIEIISGGESISTRGSMVFNLDLRCNRAGGHTGCGIYSYRVGYTSDMLHNVSVTQAGIGIRTVDCWGSTWRNVDVSFCDLGASITGMNGGAWIGGGCRSNYGAYCVVLGDVFVGNNGNSVFRFADLAFEGNAGGGIYFGYPDPYVATPEHDCITIDNVYFEGNGGPYEIKCGDDDAGSGGKVRVRYLTIRNCQFQGGIFLGDTCQNFQVGPNKFRTSSKITLGTKTSDGYGIIYGGIGQIDNPDTAQWGATWSIMFIDSFNGRVYSKGIQGISSSNNLRTGIMTPLVTSLEVTDTTANWRDLAGATLLKINHASATDFTAVTNCPDHTLLMLKFQTANTTVKHDPAKIVLIGGADHTAAAGAVLSFVSDGGILYEVGR